jgi:type I restriction enzyme, S subunit
LGAEHLNDVGGFNFEKIKYVPISFFHNLRNGLISKHDILIVKDGATTGKVSFVLPEFPFDNAAVNEHVFLLKINKQKAYPSYVFYYLFSNQGRREIMKDFRGATVGGISRRFADFVKVPLPSLPDQIRIATILSKAEALIAQRKESLRLLDELLKSTFLEMFGDPVRNEKGWEKATLRGLSVKFSDGPFGSNLKTCHYQDAGIRVIRLNNIGINKFMNTDKAFISQAHFDEVLKKYLCLPGDVVIGTMGDPNIRACIIPEYIEMAVNKADCVLCRPNKDKALPEYLTGLINSPSFLSLAANLFHGQTRTRVSMGQLAALKIPVPSIELQTQFAQIVDKIESLKTYYQASLKELENLYGSLSQRAFKGALDLSKMEVQVPEEKSKEKVVSLR